MMKRYFTLALAALAMVATGLLSAFIAMRLAIHGREVEVPNLAGLSVAEASKIAIRDGLNLTLESRFYSNDVAAGRILAQDPAAGAHVRRDWAVRITESLGAQRVTIPDLTGQSERAASVSIRRLSLDLGAVAHLAVPGDPDVVLTQTPPSNSGGVDGPRVSLLVSDSDDAETAAYVMPSLVGLSYPAAAARAAAAGLRLVAATEAPPSAPADNPADASQPSAPAAAPAPAAPAPIATVPPSRSTGPIIAQVPQAGRRVAKGDAVHVTIGHAAAPATLSP
jgi:beta-lactam-binding protein with PASTA domain